MNASVLKLARTADAADARRLLALDGAARLAWLRERLPSTEGDDDALDDMLCIFLRAGIRKKRPTEDGPPSVQCKTCGVNIVTRWDLKTRAFVAPPHGCITPWIFGTNLQHHGKAPEPSLDASVAAMLLEAWSFSDYSPGKPNMTRKVVRVLNARTQALGALLELVEDQHSDNDVVRHARMALELE